MLNKKLKEKVECLQEDVETLRKGFNKVRKICNYLILKLDIPEAEKKAFSSLLHEW